MPPLSLFFPIFAAAMIPPPPPGNTVNCAATVYALDPLVCEDQALRKMDQDIGAVMEEYEPQEHPEASLIEPQEVWFRRRAMCASKSDMKNCLRDAYADRMMIASILREGNVTTAGTPMRCSGLEDVTDMRVELRDRTAVVRDTSGAVIAVASPKPASSWQPYLLLGKASAKGLAFTGGGAKIRCKP